MPTQLARWGNSLGLRISKAVAEAAQLRAGDSVDVTVEDGTVIIRPSQPRYELDDLVARITPRNRHRETDWGGPAGNESW